MLGQHTIRVGETLFCIGRAYGVDPWAIALQNNVVRPNLVHPGMVLDIPDVPAVLPPGPICATQFGDPVEAAPAVCGGCTCRWTHIVRWGETLSWISINYGVDMWTIAQCNCIHNLNRIWAGQSLCIP